MTRVHPVIAVLVITAMAALAPACGGSSAKPRERAPKPQIARKADGLHPRTFIKPSASRDGAVTLRASDGSGDEAQVRLLGVGYPATGSGGGTRYVGPGVSAPWTTINHNTYTVSAQHRGRYLGLRVWSRGGQWRARVDGRLVSTKPRPVGKDYAVHTIGLRFSDEAEHRVDFELRNGAWLAGVVAAEGDQVSLPPAPESPSIYWLGDSFLNGTGAKYPGYADLVHVASERLGLHDITVDALGGTGYVRDNPPAKFDDFLTRVRRNVRPDRAQPDVIVVGGSINDVTESSGEVAATARKLFAHLAKAAPRAKVVVVTFASKYPVAANFALRNRAVLKAAEQAPNVAGAYDLAGEMAKRGDAKRLQRGDGHPSPRGHAVYGRAVADFLARNVPGLR